MRRIYEVLLSFFDNFRNAPVLILRQFARFDYSYRIAFAALVLFVVRLEAGGSCNRLFIERVFTVLDRKSVV